MKYFLSLLFMLSSSFISSQNILELDNNLTSNYTQTDSTKSMSINYTGENSFKKDSISLDSNTSYAYSNGQNEFTERLTLSYKRGIHTFFTNYQSNTSYVRGIKSDNWVGVGYGIKKAIDSASYGVSYAMIYQKVRYYDKEDLYQMRHSIRVKFRYTSSKLDISNEYFYQPSIYSAKNYKIYGITKFVIFPKNRIGFLVQDDLNYNTYDRINLIHNISFGLQYKFSKKY